MLLWLFFFQAKRREAYISHLPSYVGDHFKNQLASSSFAAPDLFEGEVLKRVSVESKEDSSHSAHLSLAKAAASAASGSAGKSDKKASSYHSSAATPSTSSYRGRGRGGFPVFQPRGKRKFGQTSQDGKPPKSPRTKSPAKKNFQK